MKSSVKYEMKHVDRSSPALNSLYINVTGYCNLNCRHCWIAPPHKDKLDGEGEMSAEEMVEIVKAAKDLGLSSIKLTGGEPLLREDLEPLLRFCDESYINVDMETNGTLISRDVAKMLRKYNIGHISLSLDSPYEKMHDFFRGQKGAFKRTINGIKNLQHEKLSPQVIMTLYRENLPEFKNFLRLMQEMYVNDIKINIISPLGRGLLLKEEKEVPTVREVLDFSEKLKNIKKSFKGKIFLDIPMAFTDIGEIKCHGCAVCSIKNILGILSDGSVSICGIGYLDTGLIFGNIKEDPSLLKDIWTSTPMLKTVREDIPARLEGVCKICVFKKACIGNCRAEVYHNTRSLFSPYWFCQEAYDKGLFPSTRLLPEALRG